MAADGSWTDDLVAAACAFRFCACACRISLSISRPCMPYCGGRIPASALLLLRARSGLVMLDFFSRTGGCCAGGGGDGEEFTTCCGAGAAEAPPDWIGGPGGGGTDALAASCSADFEVLIDPAAAAAADPMSAALGGVPLATGLAGSSFFSSPLAFFSSATLRPMTPRYQNMRFEISTCSYSGRRALASLMCDRR